MQIKEINDRCNCKLVLTNSDRICYVFLEVYMDDTRRVSLLLFSGPKEIAQDLYDGKINIGETR